MNSTHEDFDWHAPGVYVAHTPQGGIMWFTFADTAYSARSELLRGANRPWSALHMDGYTIQAYAPVTTTPVAEQVDQFAGMPSEAYFGLMVTAPVDDAPASPPRCWTGQPCTCRAVCGDDRK